MLRMLKLLFRTARGGGDAVTTQVLIPLRATTQKDTLPSNVQKNLTVPLREDLFIPGVQLRPPVAAHCASRGSLTNRRDSRLREHQQCRSTPPRCFAPMFDSKQSKRCGATTKAGILKLAASGSGASA